MGLFGGPFGPMIQVHHLRRGLMIAEVDLVWMCLWMRLGAFGSIGVDWVPWVPWVPW